MVNSKDILKKYGSKIEERINVTGVPQTASYSRAYLTFKEEMAPQLSRYERWCKSLGSVIKLNVSIETSVLAGTTAETQVNKKNNPTQKLTFEHIAIVTAKTTDISNISSPAVLTFLISSNGVHNTAIINNIGYIVLE